MVVYHVLTFLQTMAFVCSTCGKAYSTYQKLADTVNHTRIQTHATVEKCSTSEGLKEHKRAKHEFRYSCTECPNPVIFASKSGLLGHTRKYHSSVFKVENVYNSEVDPGFKVRGGALKKIAPSGGRRENFWGISCEKSRFYAKKILFFPILGGRAHLDPPLQLVFKYCVTTGCNTISAKAVSIFKIFDV